MVRASARKRLWLGAGGVALFVATIFGVYAIFPQKQQNHRTIAVDFIAFYTAGAFVREGRADRMYDLAVTQRYQHEMALGFGQDIGRACGPWWNPPFYALAFVPLAHLPYPTALNVWMGINILCAAVACWLLVRMLPQGTSWRSWALVPVLTVLSTPFIHALSHGQNTGTSLLLLAVTVTLWRKEQTRGQGDKGIRSEATRRQGDKETRRTGNTNHQPCTNSLVPLPPCPIVPSSLFAGLIGGLLFYKPQLAAVLAAMMLLDLGWRAAAGYAVTGAALLLVTLIVLPGSLTDYLHRMPQNLHHVQAQTSYVWERHVTFKAFWRLLLQGRGIGSTSPLVTILSLACSGAIGAMLAGAALRARWRGRFAPQVRDRLIAATIAATPLLMPFYFDYDQLLLLVPAVLLARELMTRTRSFPLPRADRWLLAVWPAYYVWLMMNPDVAEKSGVNLTVPMLSVLATLLVLRTNRRDVAKVEQVRSEPALSIAA